MTDIKHRIEAFVKLGTFLSKFVSEINENNKTTLSKDFYALNNQLKLAETANPWFTRENLLFALDQWGQTLSHHTLTKWLHNYTFNIKKPKTVAVIMAGNIPLVGFHDFICTVIAGHTVTVKQSSNDPHILPFLADFLTNECPSLRGKIHFTTDKLSKFDAVIATGSDNTARYFEYYFGKKPNIIRKSRNSVAVLTGNETHEELYSLGEDIFRYFGLGCRSVSKLFVPKGYNFDVFFKAIYPYQSIITNQKYANNYDYNKAVYLMSLFKLLENGFLMLKEDKSYASPIATVFFEYYESLELLYQQLEIEKEKIQCIVSRGVVGNEVAFGQAQKPNLWDYADGIDTMQFLLEI